MKILKKDIISIINKAQDNYEKCWDLLATLKTDYQNINSQSDVLYSFQYLLAASIYSLEVKFEEVSIEIKKEVNQIRKESFREYRKRLQLVSEVGRSLGDAFVWIFYQFDRELLTKQYVHRRNPPFRKTNGYRAELNFIQKSPIIEKKIVLYHGITTILRVGDISIFCEKEKKIIGIAEIKSKPIVNNIQSMTLHFVLRKEGFDFINSIPQRSGGNEESDDDLCQKARDRLNRQLNEITNSLNNKIKKESSNTIENKFNFERFNDFLSSNIVSGQIYDSLVGLKLTSKHKKISSYLFNTNLNEKNIEKILPDVHEILLPDGQNKLNISQFHINKDNRIISTPGFPPTFWYPININILKRIYFLNLSIFTVYNSHVLEDKFSKIGFMICNDGKLKRENGKFTHEIPKLDYYHHLVQNHVMDDDYIVGLLRDVFEKSEEEGINKKIELNFNLWT